MNADEGKEVTGRVLQSAAGYRPSGTRHLGCGLSEATWIVANKTLACCVGH